MRHAPAAALLLALAACRTLPPPAVYSCDTTPVRGTFVVYGDTRPWMFGEVWRKPAGFERRAVIARVVETHPDFVVNTGDLVASGSSEGAWATFDAELAPLRDAGIGYLPVLGNHDLRPDPEGALRLRSERFPFLGGRRWHEVRSGAVVVLAVDSAWDALTDAQRDEQRAWFRERLAAADADPGVRAVVVATHHPPVTNAVLHEPSDEVRRDFLGPAARSAKAVALFCGHVHSYERFVEDGIAVVVTGGGGAPLVDVKGPRGPHADLYDGPRGHHFCRVTPRDDRLDVEVEMLRDDGTWFVAERFDVPYRDMPWRAPGPW